MRTYFFKVNGLKFTIIDFKHNPFPGNVSGRYNEYCVVLSQAGFKGTPGRGWYEFKKELLDEELNLRYLQEKLDMDEYTVRSFIPEFNKIVKKMRRFRIFDSLSLLMREIKSFIRKLMVYSRRYHWLITNRLHNRFAR